MTTGTTGTNYQRVTDGLRTLTGVLAPYVAQELRTEFGPEWWSRGVLGVLHENQQRDLPAAGQDEELIAKLDPARCLLLITSVPHFQDHASDNWEPEGAGSDGVVNRSWSGRRSNMLSWSTCSIW